MDKSEPAFLLKRILPVVWEKPIKYARYLSHHKEHEDHEGKHIIYPCLFVSFVPFVVIYITLALKITAILYYR